ncbi:MAG: ABC transporter ATP-binding protein [Rubrivivax sp.]|nr:ABC transporter ATP-binding protein [Rubrivivax sp.]
MGRGCCAARRPGRPGRRCRGHGPGGPDRGRRGAPRGAAFRRGAGPHPARRDAGSLARRHPDAAAARPLHRCRRRADAPLPRLRHRCHRQRCALPDAQEPAHRLCDRRAVDAVHAAAGGAAGHPGGLLPRLGGRADPVPLHGAVLGAQHPAHRRLRADGAGLHRQAPGALPDGGRARGSQALPALRGAGPHGLGGAVPPAAGRDPEGARARIRAGGRQLWRQRHAHHAAPRLSQRRAPDADRHGAGVFGADPLRSRAGHRRRGCGSVDEQLRRHDQLRAQRDEPRPAGLVALCRGLRLHGGAGAGGQPVCRRRARCLRSAGPQLPAARAAAAQEPLTLETMLQIKDIQVELDAEAGLVRAIDGLRLTLQRGETFALVGESGCGKSMTALALMRLLPENGSVTAGDIHVDGQDVLAQPEMLMRQVRGGRIGMIFQEPGTSLNPVMRVGQQIVEAIETHTPLRGAAARDKAIQWLERVGIPEPARRIDEYPFRMSGGQKQRVMIAIALAAEPDYLVADEPTTALDVTIQAQILDLLKDLQRERGMGLLLITHDLAVVAGMAQRVALMYAGQIVEVARAADFFARPRHPYAQALLRALPDASRRGQPLQAIAGTVPPLWERFEGCRFAPRCAFAQAPCRAPGTLDLSDVAADHAVRCVRWDGLDAGAAAALPEAVPEAVLPRPAASPPRSPDGPDRADRAETPLLQILNLRVRYPVRGGLLQRVIGHFDAVAGVSFDLPAGRTLALVGESGCGKTTTGKAIAQLLRRQASVSGQALLGGQDLCQLQGRALLLARRQVQVIFQDPFASLDPRMRVSELLLEGLQALLPEMPLAEQTERIAGLCERVGLRRDALQRYPHEFSGGQRQRIAIARALAVQPRLLICDEPTSALDVSVQAQILNLLRELQADLGLSYLFITHNIGVVECIADQVAVMHQGRIVEMGSAQAVLLEPQQAYTRSLLAAVPRLA